MRVSTLATKALVEPGVAAEIKDDPVKALEKYARVIDTDPWIYRIIVTSLGLAVIISIVGAILLSIRGGDTPQILTALGSAAVGALAGLLAPSDRSG
jgi:hypothetical protein